ncbi:hypothetical protein GcM1_118005, partial [Golovinomyces cichoracearum]
MFGGPSDAQCAARKCFNMAEEKAARRKVELDSANSTIDQVKKRAQQLETELASSKDKIKSLTKQLDADKSKTESKRAE